MTGVVFLRWGSAGTAVNKGYIIIELFLSVLILFICLGLYLSLLELMS